jgi:hypothetical protein
MSDPAGKTKSFSRVKCLSVASLSWFIATAARGARHRLWRLRSSAIYRYLRTARSPRFPHGPPSGGFAFLGVVLPKDCTNRTRPESHRASREPAKISPIGRGLMEGAGLRRRIAPEGSPGALLPQAR